MSGQACPAEAELSDFLEGRLPEDLQGTIGDHLERCPHCAAVIERLADSWSLADLAAETLRGAGENTCALQGRLIRSPPAPEAMRAEPPLSPPEIPGYTDLELIACGGMGVVYRGYDSVLGRHVAIKLFSQQVGLSRFARLRAEREALMLARLAHPHVVTIHRTGVLEGVPYLIMEWIDGPTLQARIDQAAYDPRLAAAIVRDLSRAVAEVHAVGVVHRDLKPANVLLAPSAATGPAAVPKLIDFGLARPEEVDQALTRHGSVLGTPCYMAAEQTGLVPDQSAVGPATDIHGLGALLFAMLTGQPPYTAPTPLESMHRAVRGDLSHPELLGRAPIDLTRIIRKCLDPSPRERYHSAAALANDLEHFLAGRPVTARPVSPLVRLGKWCRRQPGLAAIASLAILLLLALFAGGTYHLIELRRANREIAARADEVLAASHQAGEAAARLTDASIRRLVRRGRALDAGDREFLRELRQSFLQWPLEPDPQYGLQVRAEGLRNVAEMFLDTFAFADALETFRAEEAALIALAAHEPADLSLVEAQLRAARQISLCLARLQQLDDAVEASRRLLSRFDAEPRKTPAMLREQILAKDRLAFFLAQQGELDAAIPLAEQAVAAIGNERKRDQANLELASDELRVLHNAALVTDMTGEAGARRRAWDRLVERAKATQGEIPEMTGDSVKAQSRGLAALAVLVGQQDGWKQAVPLVRKRWQLCQTSMAAVPAEPAIQLELIETALQAHRVFSRIGQPTGSQEMLRQALPISRRLHTEHPASFDKASMLAALLHNQAHLFTLAGEDQKAAEALEQEISLLAAWQAADGHRQTVIPRLAAAQKIRNGLDSRPD